MTPNESVRRAARHQRDEVNIAMKVAASGRKLPD